MIKPNPKNGTDSKGFGILKWPSLTRNLMITSSDAFQLN